MAKRFVSPKFQLNTLVGPNQSRFGCVGQEIDHSYLEGIEPIFLDRVLAVFRLRHFGASCCKARHVINSCIIL
jgi:hypothetical protein